MNTTMLMVELVCMLLVELAPLVLAPSTPWIAWFCYPHDRGMDVFTSEMSDYSLLVPFSENPVTVTKYFIFSPHLFAVYLDRFLYYLLSLVILFCFELLRSLGI